MKKISFILALAALTAGSSMAAQHVAVKKNNVPQTLQDVTADMIVSNNATSATRATRAVASLEDVYGQYNGSGISQLQSNGGETVNFSMVIGPSKKGGNFVTISQFPFEDCDEMEATVDLAAGTISIAPYQDAWYNSNYPENYVEFVTGLYDEGTMSPAVGTITEKGIEFPEDQYIGFGLNNKAGYFLMMTEVTLKKVIMFSYKASEWTDAGEALFQDGWVNTCFEGTEYVVAPQNVQLKRSTTTAGLMMLYNPYKGKAWETVNYTANADGYILFNIANPDCVCVMPYVPSGYNGYVFGLEDELCMYNQEGVDLEDGFTQAEQVEYCKELAAMNGEDLKDYLSYMDADGKIKIFNAFFGCLASPLAYYGWTDAETNENQPIVSYITIDMAGVNSILADDANAPVKYFNLQGMEVANPEAGQLVIKKQGSKTSKYIAK